MAICPIIVDGEVTTELTSVIPVVQHIFLRVIGTEHQASVGPPSRLVMFASDDIKYGTNAFNKVISKIIKIMGKNRKAAEKKKKDEAEAKAKRLAKEAKQNKK